MGIEGIGKGMHLHVSVGVRLHAALDEGQADDAVLDAVAVLAVVEEADAVVALGEVHPLLGTALKACLVPGGVGVDLSGDVAELDFKGGLVRVDVHGELRLEQMLVELPVHLSLEVDAAGVGVEVNLLPDGAEAAPVGQGQRRADRAVGHPLHLQQLVHRPGLLRVEHIDVPVVVVDGLVLIDPQLVGLLARLHQLPVKFLVEEGDDSALLVQRDGVEGRLQMVGVAVDEGTRSASLREGQRLVALGWEVLEIRHGAVGGLLNRVEGAGLILEGGDA